MNIEDLTTLEPSTPYAAPTAAATPEAHGESEAPLAQLGRFRLQRILGKGGMGQVWEAWDPNLERPVAIKRLLTTDWSARRRFVREGRLQATIAHPGICPVFEVDEHEGEPYLVMPKLDGVRLDEALEDASLEHTLDLMRQVAEAVHAAHQKGLVHRDLKPANIMVESPPDAPPRPVVLDFGIARPVGSKGLTRTGQLVGTPAFMAPEQVEGQGATLDRRVDVYALGATLYRIVTGRPPHVGTGTPLLLSIVHEEPRRLPSGDVPAEVEAIVFKCLEKDKNRRYDSARALAEDLERYLAGEPVHARPVTRWIRLGKWLRRHRVAVRVTAATAMIAVAALAWGGWSTWRSEARQEAALRFGAQVEEIEALARYSHLVPLHDTRADQARLRSRLDAIRPSLDDRDPVVRALASHALGRGHLALDEPELARGHLEVAYAIDPENTEIAADLGRTLSELYRDRLTTLERFGDPAKRDELAGQLVHQLAGSFNTKELQEQAYRSLGEPALDLLRDGANRLTGESTELAALIRFHQGKPREALDILADTPPAPAWMYERWRLEGDIRRSWSINLFHENDPTEDNTARQQLEAARAAYRRALAIAPSHVAILLDEAQAITLMLQLGLVSLDEAEPLIDQARQLLQNAMEADPEHLDSWLWAMRVELAAAEHATLRARDPAPILESAIQLGNRALQSTVSSDVWFELARMHELLGRSRRARGQDPSEAFERAAQAFDRVEPSRKDYAFYVSQGILLMEIAGMQAEKGLEAGATYDAAIEAYGSAAALHSKPFAAWFNLGVALFNAADLAPNGQTRVLTQALEVFEHARKLRPESMFPFYYLGLTHQRLAQEMTQDTRLIDRIHIAQAVADLAQATELTPDRFEPWIGLASAIRLQAFDAFYRGNDVAKLLGDARSAYEKGLRLAPEQSIGLFYAGQIETLAGRWALRQGHDPSLAVERAESLCQRALEARYEANALYCVGDVSRLQAELLVTKGKYQTAHPFIKRAEQYFTDAFEDEQDHIETLQAFPALLVLEARRLGRTGRNPAIVLDRARQLLDRAFVVDEVEITTALTEAHWYLETALSNGEIHADLSLIAERGRQRVNELQAKLPRSPEARRLGQQFDAMTGGR